MLNGVDPLLIIVIKKKPPVDLMGPPLDTSILDAALDAIGIPIPIYLSERLTKIYVDSESRSIDVETKVETVTTPDITGDVGSPVVTQTAVDTLVTINLIASRDSIMLTAVIAMMELLIKRLTTKEYSIHYINRSTVIFGGLLHRFATSTNPNEDKIQIELVLSTADKQLPTPPVTSIPLESTETVSLSTPPG